MFDLLKCSFNNVCRKKVRSFLNILSVTIGVGSVVLIGNVSHCGSIFISEELDNLGLGSLSVSVNYKDHPNFNLGENELQTIKNIKHVTDASPIIVKNIKVSNFRKQSSAIMWGIDSISKKIVSLNTVYGRYLNKYDVKNFKNVCMLDQKFAKEMYGYCNVVGKKISITLDSITDNYDIIGVIKAGSGLLENVVSDYVTNFVYVPYTTLQSYTGRSSFDQIAIKVDRSNDIESIGNSITKKLNLTAGKNDVYRSSNLAKQRNGLTSILNIITLILSSVGAISLIVASLSIMTVMIVSVGERTKEIGIKKSIGARRSTIMLEFIFESILITLIGSVLGSISGLGISAIASMIYKVKFNVRFDIMILAAIISVFSGGCLGIYPAVKASRLNPVEALRSE